MLKVRFYKIANTYCYQMSLTINLKKPNWPLADMRVSKTYKQTKLSRQNIILTICKKSWPV